MKNLLIAGSCMCCVMALGSGQVFAQEIDLGNYQAEELQNLCLNLELEQDAKDVQKVIIKRLSFQGEKKQGKIKIKVPGMINGKQVEIVRRAFYGLKASETYIDLEFYAKDDKSAILPEDCSLLFADASAIQNISFDNIQNISFDNIDASQVKNMHEMFADCWGLEALNISNFDVANVTSMEAMFSGCERLQTLIMENLNAQNVMKMQNMFYNCRSLEKLSLKGSKYCRNWNENSTA